MRRRTLYLMPARSRGPRGGFNFALLAYGNAGAAVPTERHYFAAGTSVSSQTLGANIRDGVSSFGNRNVAVFGGGHPTPATWRHTFDGELAVPGAALAVATQRYAAGFGYALVGYACHSANVARYTYANDTSASTASIGYSAQLLSAISGPDYGVVGGGFSTITSTDRYRYSNETRAAATALSAGRYGLTGLSGPTYGLFHGGFNASVYISTTDEYENATGTRTSGTNATNAKQGGMGAADINAGRVLGGQDASGANLNVEAYNWTNKASSIGSNRITYLRSYGGAVSGCAPHLTSTPA